jgi:tetratricopeptide (TPR) repeat protein
LPTVTPLPFSENCSIKVPGLQFQKPNNPLDMDSAILDYLNAGGVPEKLDALTYDVTIRELNNDDAPEIIFYDYRFPDFVMFTCDNGKYKEAITRQVYVDLVASFVDILAITDNNKNGFPEVFIEGIGCIYWSCGGLYVVEWDGEEFVHRVKESDSSGSNSNYAEMTYRSASYLKDLDGDGVAELIWKGEVMPEWHMDRWSFYPQRLATHIYKWDGMNYTEQIVEYSTPEFRFQAVQDGDLYSKAGFYEKALQSYQQAATHDSLKWWTDDSYDYTIASYGVGVCAENISTCPVPVEDPRERPILSAYASFKKIIVYLLLDDVVKADATYQELQRVHPIETPGYPITEMAIAFWTEYQTSQDVSKACVLSIASIEDQTDVLSYLTGGYNGLADQGIDYEYYPDEVCPFK